MAHDTVDVDGGGEVEWWEDLAAAGIECLVSCRAQRDNCRISMLSRMWWVPPSWVEGILQRTRTSDELFYFSMSREKDGDAHVDGCWCFRCGDFDCIFINTVGFSIGLRPDQFLNLRNLSND